MTITNAAQQVGPEALTSARLPSQNALSVQQQPLVSPWVQYGGSYATAAAGILAATLAALVALRGISENRKNMLDQLNLQRELGARSSWANVVSANRQRWIDALREDLAEFISADFVLAENLDLDEEDATPAIVRKREIVEQARQRRRLMFRRIQLRLNREKPEQKALWEALRAVMPATGEDHREAVRRLADLSRRVLRKEWERVKSEASGEGAPTRKSTPLT
jgi:hypothetical protein